MNLSELGENLIIFELYSFQLHLFMCVSISASIIGLDVLVLIDMLHYIGFHHNRIYQKFYGII